MWFGIVALVIAVLALGLSVINALALGGLFRDLEDFKKGVRGMADVADKAFDSDRLRLTNIEKFLVLAFKLDDLFGVKLHEEQKLEDTLQPTPAKKKTDLN